MLGKELREVVESGIVDLTIGPENCGSIGYASFQYENIHFSKEDKTYSLEISADITAFESGIINYIFFCRISGTRADWFKIIEENNLWKYMKEIKGKK